MIIDGKKIATQLQEELKIKIASSLKKPALSVILVGKNEASLIYIRNKKKACERVGISFHLHEFDENVSDKEILAKINFLNNDINTDGIFVQLPLPKHINEMLIIESINPKKDVDGFHPLNVGKMLIGDEDTFLPCTPLGIHTLLKKASIEIESKHVVIVGRSNIVGKPLAAMLVQKKKDCNATVTVAHSYSKNLKEITRSADILIAAIGKPKFITKEMVAKNTVVVDVGLNYIKLEDGTHKIVGDVDFENVVKIASYITPVPGGVGPMTVTMLLANTFKSFNEKKLW